MPQPQIFAYSGVPQVDTAGRATFALFQHAIRLAGPHEQIRLCYVPTAIGDAANAVDQYTRLFRQIPGIEFSALTLFPQPSVVDARAHLLAQHLVFVEGGSVVNLMALWRAHGLRDVFRECWRSGVVLSGPSAGSICWHESGTTDSFSDELDPFTDGIGLLPYSNGVHDNADDQPRRTAYRQAVAEGVIGPGYATENGVGLHYIGTELHEAVSIRPGRAAWWVEPDGHGSYTERRIEPRQL